MAIPQERDLQALRARLTAWLGQRLPAGADPDVGAIELPEKSGFSSETLLLDASWRERDALEKQGFRVHELFDWNRVTTPAWWLNGRILRRRHFGRLQLKLVNLFTWLFRRVEKVLPWPGASLVAVAERPREA